MNWVFEELARLGVEPVGPELDEASSDRGTLLRDAIVRRAWSLMQERGWVPRAPTEFDVDVQDPQVSESDNADHDYSR